VGAPARSAGRIGLPGDCAVRLWLRDLTVKTRLEHGRLCARSGEADPGAWLEQRYRRRPLDGRLPGDGLLPPLSRADRLAGILRHASQRRCTAGAGRAAGVQGCGDGERSRGGRGADGAELLRAGNLRIERAAGGKNAPEHRSPDPGGDQRSHASHRRARGLDRAAERNHLPDVDRLRHGRQGYPTRNCRRNARPHPRLKARTDPGRGPPLKHRTARDVQRHFAGAFAEVIKTRTPQPV